MNATQALLAAWLAAGMLGRVDAADQPTRAPERAKPALGDAREDKLVENARGVFDMSKSPRPYVAFLVLDQAGNRYPSFWCGRNLSGQITFDARRDILDGRISLNNKGGFCLQITNAAHKKGMQAVLPGGAWVDGLKDLDFRIAVDSLEKVALEGVQATRITTGRGLAGTDGQTVIFVADFRGSVSVGGKSAPIAGKVRLGFLDGAPAFTVRAEFGFPGQALGLDGAAGDGISATLYTSSPMGTQVKGAMEPAGGLDGFAIP